MSGCSADGPSRPGLPPDHVLCSGAVTYPDAFDRYGCPLVMFPVDSQDKLVSDLTKEEVADFISYFLRLHSKNKEECLVSVVADLREANLSIARRVAESLLLLELHRRTVHSMYVVQPRKRDVLKLLQKLLVLKKPNHSTHSTYKCMFLKEVCELWNYIDRSQLTASLGGYLVYCHSSWVSFLKEIDRFAQEFVAVVQRLPVCITALQSISALPVPTDPSTLEQFYSSNRTQLQQILSDLGLDELLRECECVLEKFRCPESDQCYQAMVGTHLYKHTALEMLHNYERITAAVEKVELLWQQAFSKARVQLQLLNLQKEAQQVESQMECMWQKLQCYSTERAADGGSSETLKLEFESSVYTHAMALVRRAEDVIHTLVENVGEHSVREQWVVELEEQKERFSSAVEHQYSSIRTHCLFHQCYNKIQSWYNLAVCENFLQDLLWATCCKGQDDQTDVSAGREWRSSLESFLRVHTCPQVEELVQLAHLSNIISEPQLHNAGKQLAHRCMNLRKLLTSPGSATLSDLQLALQCQYEYLKGSRETVNSDIAPWKTECAEIVDGERSAQRDSGFVSVVPSLRPSVMPDIPSLVTKPPSLSSFDSGFEGAGCGHVEGKEGPDCLTKAPCNTNRVKVPELQISEENVFSLSSSVDVDHGTAGSNSSKASIHIIPKITADSLNLEIKVQRSATLPENPWLSLPVDNLESSYTVTITPSSPALQRAPKCLSPLDRCRDQPTQTDSQGCIHNTEQDHERSFHAELSPIRNVLSSTMTEGRDRAESTADAPPTLLWDTYDLHDVGHDTCDRLSDTSIGDWELEEKQELQAVEEILGRTAGILLEEENVLAQEEALDVLLKADHVDRQWPSWNHMSSIDLTEAGVIGLEDNPDSPLHFSKHDSVTSSATNSEAFSPAVQLLNPDRNRVSQELKYLEVLEEKILEEKLKIQELRKPERTPERRRKFLEQLEREKQEVEEMERSLSREAKKREGKTKKQPRGSKVVKCSIMEMASVLQSFEDEDAVCDEALLVNCRRQTLESKPLESSAHVQPCIPTDGAASSRPSDSAVDEFVPRVYSSQSHYAKSIGSTTEDFGNCVDFTKLHEESTNFRLSTSAQGELIHSANSHQPLEHSHLTTADSTNSRPSASLVAGMMPLADSSQTFDPLHVTTEHSINSRPNSTLDAMIYCADSNPPLETPHLTKEDCTSSQSPNSVLDEIMQDLNRVVLDDLNKDTGLVSGSSLKEITKEPSNKGIYLSLDDQDKMPMISGSTDSGRGISPLSDPPVTCTGADEKKTSDSTCTFTCISTAADPESPSETGHQIENPPLDASESNINKNPPEKTIETYKTAAPDLHSGEGFESSQERAAFDPGGPKPHPRAHRLKKSAIHNAESSFSEHNSETDNHQDFSIISVCNLAPSGGPKPKERRNPPPRTYPSAAELNRNNNNPRVYLHQSDPEAFLKEPLAKCVFEAVDQTEVDREGVLSGSDSHAECKKTNAKVLEEEGPSARSMCRSPGLHQQLQICSREMSDFLTPVVLDTGSGLVKAGFADQELPSIIFPTAVGVPKYEEVMSGSAPRNVYVGHDAQHMRGVLTLHYPMKNGIISNWDQIEMIWQHMFQQLSVDAEDHPVLLTEGVMNLQLNRQRMVQLMFETFNVPLTFIALQPVLALYAAGRTTGVVFDSGDGVSHSVPVFDGYSLPHAVQRFTLAGSDVTLQLKKLLLEQGVCMRTSAELEIVREIKERCCCVALDFEVDLKGGAANKQMNYTLPDGQVVSLTTERFRAPEILFKPELIGCDHYGMHESVFRSVLQSDIDLRKSFLGNIVLSGGNTLLAGLPERLQLELSNLAPAGIAEHVRVVGSSDRDFSVWKGGAILSGLKAFSSAWISREEYEEFGPNIVHRKCF